MGLFDWLKSRFRSDFRRQRGLRVDETGVAYERSNGIVESVHWSDLQRVTIFTTDGGPFAEDAFFVLHASQGGCVVPQGAPDSEILLERLQQLPGFDNEAVVRAMSCTTENEFPCWERSQVG